MRSFVLQLEELEDRTTPAVVVHHGLSGVFMTPPHTQPIPIQAGPPELLRGFFAVGIAAKNTVASFHVSSPVWRVF